MTEPLLRAATTTTVLSPSHRRQQRELANRQQPPLRLATADDGPTRQGPASAGQLRVELIRDPEALAAIASPWRRLAVQRANPFVSPEWHSAWLESGDGDEQPFVLAAFRDEDLVGVLPLVLERAGWRRRVAFPGRQLGDRFHPACAAADEVAVAVACGDALARERILWNMLRLERVPAGSAWIEALTSGIPGSCAPRRMEVGTLPYVNLQPAAGSWETYLEGRSRNFRKQLGRKQRALEERRSAVFRRTTDRATLDRDVDALLALHFQLWPGDTSPLAPARAQAFHRAFAAAALEQGWLRLWLLEIDDETVAADYGWRLGDVALSYQAGRDRAWDDASVGFVLLVHALRDAIETGAVEFDLLYGDEDYKARFATGERAAHTLVTVRTLSGLGPLAWSLRYASRPRGGTGLSA